MVAATTFLGAFLLFLIQPMAAKALLPIFGGAASVWTVCLLFFQTALLAGYTWAHYSRRAWHLGLLAVSLAAALLAPLPGSGVHSPGQPSFEILRLLAMSIGIPYIVLAANSPLLQRFAMTGSPYRLYAVANGASLAALLAYPILVEPAFTLTAQWTAWKAMYAGFSLLCALAVWRAADQPRGVTAPTHLDPLWVALPAAGTAALMATTNQMCQEIAAVPFLWILPLALYLISFVLAFDHPRWYHRRTFTLLAAITIPSACGLSVMGLNYVPLPVHLAVYSLALFCGLMLCHGELAARRPDRGSLTRYYLTIAAGGAAGGLLVAFGAPLVFTSYAEFPLSLGLCAALALYIQVRESGYRQLPAVVRASYAGLMLAALVPIATLNNASYRTIHAERRNFYGILRVSESNGLRIFTHGATTHGTQFVDDPRRRTPTTYYGWLSGAGRALEEHPKRNRHPLRAGFVGLGAGTLARYGRKGDQFRFYEINPEVIALARSHFTYLADSKPDVAIVEGDARLRLQQEVSQNFDVLIVDAFSSDAIPVHLLTAECAAVYRRHLAPGGWLVFHISNHTLDLEPVVRAIAARLNWSVRKIESPQDGTQGTYAATWMLLDSSRPYEVDRRTLLWTDRFASLWSVLK